MIQNPVIYIKKFLFTDLNKEIAVVSDSDIAINKKNRFLKLEKPEKAVGKTIALAEKYKEVFVVLDTWNWDSIYRLFKSGKTNIFIFNLNTGLTGLWNKISMLDLDDIDIHNVDIYEPMDIENIKVIVNDFLKKSKMTFVRIPNKDMEEKVGWDEVDIDYNKVLNLAEFGIQWFEGTILAYGSMFQESLQAANLLQEDSQWMDMFWIWNYKIKFSTELIKSILWQERLIVIWDFDSERFKNKIYSNLYNIWAEKMDIYFITPENLSCVEKESQLSFCGMDGLAIYSRIKQILS